MRYFLLLFIFLNYYFVIAQESSSPKITFDCYNSYNGHITTVFPYAQIDLNGLGQGSSEKIQFNINRDAVPGTIFVNKQNDGVCIASISGDFILTGGDAQFTPGGSYTENSEINNIENSVSIEWKSLSNKQIMFSVHRIGESKGNVTPVFFVFFKPAKG